MSIRPRLDDLKQLLAKRPLSRSEVVHFMLEIRKLIDQMDDRYPVLEFFCDWVMHPQLDRSKGAKQVLAMFDEAAEIARHNSGALPNHIMDRLGPVLSLTRLRDELTLILAEHRFDSDICDRLDPWGQFLATYVELISCSPLICKNPTASGLKHIDNIRVLKGSTPKRATRRDGRFMFSIEWCLRKGPDGSGSVRQ